MKTCETCRWFFHNVSIRQCRRFPPTLQPLKETPHWSCYPTPATSEWCGEHKERDSDEWDKAQERIAELERKVTMYRDLTGCEMSVAHRIETLERDFQAAINKAAEMGAHVMNLLADVDPLCKAAMEMDRLRRQNYVPAKEWNAALKTFYSTLAKTKRCAELKKKARLV